MGKQRPYTIKDGIRRKSRYAGEVILCKKCGEEKTKVNSRAGTCFDCHHSQWLARRGLSPTMTRLEAEKLSAESAAKRRQGLKPCFTCKKHQPDEEFLIRGPIPIFSPSCHSCQRERVQHRWDQSETHYIRLSGADVIILKAMASHCHICGEDFSLKKRKVLDHDHVTLDIRGVLCDSCNTAIGKLKDSPDLLRKAAEYIEKGPWVETKTADP